ncbi:MAG TPA: hypothetical protein VM223_07290 [Planctomycetota bacterium]|nr:hypothetical protein [Planctomycetota bacterium]
MPERISLSAALDYVYGPGVDWSNPIRPYVASSLKQTPYEAYRDLKPEFQGIVCNMVGHDPQKDEE